MMADIGAIAKMGTEETKWRLGVEIAGARDVDTGSECE